jgi:hypothetical protein
MEMMWSNLEYDLLRELADHFQTRPAALVRKWVLERASDEYLTLLAAREGKGKGEGQGVTPTQPISPTLPVRGSEAADEH